MSRLATTRVPAKSSAPYMNASDLMLEVKFDGDENWQRLATAEAWNRNRRKSLEEKVSELEAVRDRWTATGARKYLIAQYRIGYYKFEADKGWFFESYSIAIATGQFEILD